MFFVLVTLLFFQTGLVEVSQKEAVLLAVALEVFPLEVDLALEVLALEVLAL